MSVTPHGRPGDGYNYSPAFRRMLREVLVHGDAVGEARAEVAAAEPGSPNALAAVRKHAGLLVSFDAERSQRALQTLVATSEETTLRAIIAALEPR